MTDRITLHHLASFVEDHGHEATIIDDYVDVTVPWVEHLTLESGEDHFQVRTWQEARDVLGY